MINILSIRLGLAFAPYLLDAVTEFLNKGTVQSRVVRQAGSGLIIRTEGEVALRYQSRECFLGEEDVRHYRATLAFRADVYDVMRMSDEIVISTVGKDILLSYPQSEIWLDRLTVDAMLRAHRSGESVSGERDQPALPDWLSISSGSGRLLLSDGRTGRWILLGADHISELERRLASCHNVNEQATSRKPPTIPLKGLSVHLQSALTLADTLDQFERTGDVTPVEEVTSTYVLKASKSTQGIELTDSSVRVVLTAREARKWAGILRDEIDRLKVAQVERGKIRTTFAQADHERWVLQWGDEVFVPGENGPNGERGIIGSLEPGGRVEKEVDGFRLLLDRQSSACVALSDAEWSYFASMAR
jgi:hypothetical protein